MKSGKELADEKKKSIKNQSNMKKFLNAITALMVIVAVVCATGCTKDPDNGGINNGNGGDNSDTNNHEYVNLGLPSGTLWATCNVGANAPEDFGDYFAWGETEAKGTYFWDTYKYCNGNSCTLTKYCTNSSYGNDEFADNLVRLLPEDDAATVNWGGNWRMPTKEEWEELWDNTRSTWMKYNGVHGKLFTASNGNSIFLPAAGVYRGENLDGSDSWAFYWSCSLATDKPYIAYRFMFSSDSYPAVLLICEGRPSGLSVRAVRSSSQD